MDAHEPFLNAILASRHDDLPRLVYADWLEETGDPTSQAHAHFIRTQIHLESADPRSELYREMRTVEARILETYLDEWRWDLPDFVRYGSDVERVKWRRGFPDDLGPMHGANFREFGSQALEQLPLTSLHLDERSSSIDFALYHSLRHITRLKLGPSFGGLMEGLEDHREAGHQLPGSLQTTPHLSVLQQLDLSENKLTDAWISSFAASFATASFAQTLEHLDLSRNFGITDVGALILATAPVLNGLKTLRVRDTGISTLGISRLKKRFETRAR